MAESASITIRCKPELKADFQKVCERMGTDMSAAISLFMYQTVIQEKIPFTIRTKEAFEAEKEQEQRLLAYTQKLQQIEADRICRQEGQ